MRRYLFAAVAMAIPFAAHAQQTPCVDLNTATATELQRIIHIGPERAAEIVRLRGIRPFGSVNELTRVSGIATARMRNIREQGVACVRAPATFSRIHRNRGATNGAKALQGMR